MTSLHTLTLRNFKKHEALTAHFGPGLTAITGDNAAGKSTILKGILFALFGPRPVGVAENIPTWDAEGPTEVTLDYTLPIHGQVRITRTLKNCKIITPDGALLANGTSPCNKLIEEAYGMDPAHLQLLLLSRQGESQGLLAMGATALQKIVERLSKVEVLDKVLKAIGDDLGFIAGTLSGMKDLGDLKELEEAVSILVFRCDQEAMEMQLSQKQLDYAQEQHGAAIKAYSDGLELENQHKRIGTSLQTLQQQIQGWRADLETATRALAEFPPGLSEAKQALDQQERACLELLAELNQRITSADQAQKRLSRAEWELTQAQEEAESSAKVEAELNTRSQLLAEATEERTTRRLELAQAEKQLKEAEEAIKTGACFHCQRPFSGVDMDAFARREEAARAGFELATRLYNDARRVHTQLETEEQALKKLFFPGAAQKVESAAAACEQARQDLAEALGKDTLASLQSSKEGMRSRLEELSSESVRISKFLRERESGMATITAAEAALAKLGKQSGELLRESDSLPPAPDVAALKEQVDYFQVLVNQRGTDAALSKQRAKQFAIDLGKARQALQYAKEAIERKEQLEKDEDVRKRLQAWLRKSRSDLLSEMWDGLLHYASHLINLTTDGKLSQVYKEGDDLWVVEEGRPVPVSEVSGFQRSLLGLALRIGLSRVFFGQEHVLLLDEPTADARDENAARVAGMLQGLGSQVVFVTHREGDAANAGTVITI